MNRKFTSLLFIVISLFLLPSTTFSEIYKWVDADGKTHFSSSPPTHGEAETVEPKAINTYSSPDKSDTPLSETEEPNSKKINRKKVVMYSAVWCSTCKTAKSYFRRKGIPFKEYDIETSAKGRKDYKKLKGTGVPIIMAGKQRMDGFSASSFESMYGG
jgi:glutaredoxin